MKEFENELIWYDRSNWHAGQILTLKKFWNVDFEIFTKISRLLKS